MDAFSYTIARLDFILPISDTRNSIPKNIEMSNKKLKLTSDSRNRPPRNGPVRLPTLKKIPHNKFPVGNSGLGVNSDIYEIPRE